MKQKLINITAQALSGLVNHKIIPISLFRNLEFKGKLTISSHLNSSSYPCNDIYRCRDLLFDISFTDEIQKSIYLNLYEVKEIKLLHKLVNTGSCCIDVGANIGYFSLHMAKAVGKTGKVFAFEPDPSNFQKLIRNVALNQYTNISCFQLALSFTSKKATFSRTLNVNSGWGRMGEWKSSQERVTVETISLDEFIDNQKVQQVDFLKCDIEGHEIEFLKGARESLSKGIVSNILIEYCGHELQKQGYGIKDYLEILGGYGYKPATLNLKLLSPLYDHALFNLLFTKSGR